MLLGIGIIEPFLFCCLKGYPAHLFLFFGLQIDGAHTNLIVDLSLYNLTPTVGPQ